MTLGPGTRLGPYEILSPLGAGGMGEVYRARDTKLGREVAVKVLPESFSQNEERLARFEREARLLASLNHPGIATIHGLEESDGVHYLVMELVPGETLAERISHHPVPINEALPLFQQIAEALEAAHEKGIIHRDLKPANIKITLDGKAKVLDFGLAKALGVEQPSGDLSQSPTLTRDVAGTGAVLGTAAYMSPEQARGKTVDDRTDIWAFGCVLYEALTGRAPFLGETASDTLVKILEHEPNWNALPEKTPPWIRTLLRRCLRKDARKRLHHMGDVRIEVREALYEPVQDPAGPIESVRTKRWKWTSLWIGIGLAIGIVTIALWAPWRSAAPEERPVLRAVVPTGPIEVKGDWYVPLALSPDDTQLVYTAVREGTRQLYLRDMASAEAVPIPGTEDGMQPFFSPDGQWVGFLAEGKLNKVSLLGGPPLPLTDVHTGAQRLIRGTGWGPEDNIVFGDGFSRVIRQVSAEGGTSQAVTALDQEKGQYIHCCPRILPGGNALLFTALNNSCGNPSIYLQSLETGQQRILIEGGTEAQYLTTGHIVFAKAGSLLASPFDLERLELTGDPVPLVENVKMGSCGEVYFYLSENGSLAYVAGSERQSENMLVWVDRQGNEELITSKPRMIGPRLSPDGKRLAVWRYGDDPQVWLYEFARDTLTQLTVEGRNFWPQWTPDGQWLAITTGGAPDGDLSWIPADGSGPAEELLSTENLVGPSSWSPDGEQIVFQQGDRIPGFDIWVLPVEADAESWPFLATPASEYQGVLSPDGRWLAYVSNETGREEVYVTSFPRSTRKWTVSMDGGMGPAWAPNGKELFYRQGEQMMAVEILTEPEFTPMKPELLFVGSYDADIAYGRNYDVASDGRFIMLKSTEESPPTQVNVILNWSEELKRRVPPK